MKLIGKNKLMKLKAKNIGNKPLCAEIDKLINDIEIHNWKNEKELKSIRKDADRVHSDGFYFFNIEVHRTMILLEFDENGATVVWVGNHQDYERVFKNDKKAIKKWLKTRNYI